MEWFRDCDVRVGMEGGFCVLVVICWVWRTLVWFPRFRRP